MLTWFPGSGAGGGPGVRRDPGRHPGGGGFWAPGEGWGAPGCAGGGGGGWLARGGGGRGGTRRGGWWGRGGSARWSPRGWGGASMGNARPPRWPATRTGRGYPWRMAS